MSERTPLLVIGDALLDHDLTGRAGRLAPDAPVPVVDGARRTSRPGGAALAACLAADDGRRVTLVTGLGDDPSSRRLRGLLAGRVRLIELPLRGTLASKTRVLVGNHPLLRLDDGDGRVTEATEEARRALAEAGAVLVSDYGRGAVTALRRELAQAVAAVPVVWDPHPRGDVPVPGVRLVTPSAAEARGFAAGQSGEDAHAPARGQRETDELRGAARNADCLVRAWQASSVAVTLGARGALLSHGGTPLLVPTPVAETGDACGAGDRFASHAAGLIADGELTEMAVAEAVRAASRFVAEGGAAALGETASDLGTVPAPEHGAGPVPVASPSDTDPFSEPAGDALAKAARTRADGGTVVAAGGCFDLLHAGHVALLQAARRAGDCLVVCLNSDDSVRRRKGGDRPLVPQADRARVLRALECVDAVALFDEDTPERLLRRLRPDVWVKGGDYALAELPEADAVAGWGGQVLLLPYLDGRSTSGLAERAARAGARGGATA
jgi:rfaE bifunctional protein nucleotidyltransferase chain/domain